VARALVRLALSAGGGVPPHAWRFRRGQHGKPEIAAPEEVGGPCFSLSHTDGLVVCLVARVDAGVDAEPLRRRLAVMSLARRFFTPTEIRDLRDFPRAYRRERFLQIWTLKEAYLKARGFGLAGGLDALSVFVSGGEPVEQRVAPDDSSPWQLGFREVSDEHVVAYALRGDGVRVHTCPADRVMR
jgi:4'-phosphopantetheinyl transferase